MRDFPSFEQAYIPFRSSCLSFMRDVLLEELLNVSALSSDKRGKSYYICYFSAC